MSSARQERVVWPGAVRSDRVRGKLINLKNRQFGTLTVVRRSYPWETPGYVASEQRIKTRQARWVCECVCGGMKVLLSQNLRKGNHRCCCS